jgi:hypothetical protein
MRSRLKNGIVSIRGNEGACPLVYSRTGFYKESMQTMTAFGSFKVIRLKNKVPGRKCTS